MRTQQRKGDYIVIGIAECEHYTEKYDLPKLFEVHSDGYMNSVLLTKILVEKYC